MRVLIVDKNPYDLEAFRSALTAPDVEVLSARDGEAALQTALEHLPEVVVTASSLGQMGGFALSRELKTLAEAGALPEPKVVVLLERAHDAWLANWSRSDEWRTKPIEPGELDRLVREITAPPEPASAPEVSPV